MSRSSRGRTECQVRGTLSADRISRASRQDLKSGSFPKAPRSKRPSSARHLNTNSNNRNKHQQEEENYDESWQISFKEEKASKVYCLDLHGKKLTKIAGLQKYQNCKSLDLSCNQIKKIENCEENIEICELKLYSNEIKVIEGLEKLRKLQNLQLQHNQITCIGDGLKELKMLKILNLASNRICDVTALELKTCSNLVFLDLSSNNLRSFKCLNAIPYLEELYLAENAIEECPDASCCKKLQEIDLASNNLSRLEGIKNLPSLVVLDVSENRLEKLESLGSSRTIQRLNVSKNKISSTLYISKSFPNLEVLSMVDNEMDSTDGLLHLKQLKDLKELYIEGNPVKSHTETSSSVTWKGKVSEILPQLEILDGHHIGNSVSKNGDRHLMRPLTPSQGLSTKTVKDQINVMGHELSMYENMIISRFESMRSLLKSLPEKPVSTTENKAKVPPKEATASANRTVSLSPDAERPNSRCGSRARIREALDFASQHFTDGKQDFDLAL